MDEKHAITCRGKIVHSNINRCQYKVGVSQIMNIHLKKILQHLNVEDMFWLMTFNFALSDDKNTISEFCELHYINVHIYNSLRVLH